MNRFGPIVWLWILGLLGSSPLWAAESLALSTASDGILQGLKEPIVGMHHLTFCLMAGFLGLTVRKNYRFPVYYLLALIPGYALERFVSVPVFAVNIAVALSVAVLLFNLWFHEKLGQFAILILTFGGFLHGLSFAQSVAGSSLYGFLGFVVTATLIQALLCFGFGVFALRLSLKSVDGFEGLENILSALGTGVSIAYFVLAF